MHIKNVNRKFFLIVHGDTDMPYLLNNKPVIAKNKIIVFGDICKLFVYNPSNKKVSICIFDLDDLHRIKDYKWHYTHPPKHQQGYFRSHLGNGKIQALHRLINNTPKGFETDHRDFDTHNNRKYNLRTCTHEENTRHRRTFKNSSTGVKGVTFDKKSSKYMATLVLGKFDTLEEAKNIYNKSLKLIFPEYGYIEDCYNGTPNSI